VGVDALMVRKGHGLYVSHKWLMKAAQRGFHRQRSGTLQRKFAGYASASSEFFPVDIAGHSERVLLLRRLTRAVH
jgi:hypothetical protein